MIGGLVAATAITLRQNDLTPASLPTPITLVGWGLALVGAADRRVAARAAAADRRGAARIVAGGADHALQPACPAGSLQRTALHESQLLAYEQDQTAPGRILSISGLLFDPGDRATLEARYAGLSTDARALAFDAVKMKEVLAANLPLIWGIPSVDGFDGGLLPTAYYTAFTSLFLPPRRTAHGRWASARNPRAPGLRRRVHP